MSNKSSSRKEVKVIFVIPEECENENEMNDLMKMTYQECVEADLAPEWMKDIECLTIAGPKNLIFVLQEFAGDVFQKLRSTKSVVVGPMCLRSSIAEGLPIPENKSPVFTTAMRGVVLTASQVSPATKAAIKEKVGFMGGVYTSNLSKPVTHLVTNAVRSAKYEMAGERGIPAMTVEWVDTLWTESQKRNIKATDPELLKRYKCPIFLNMFITCSNFNRKEKEELKQLITQNGGTFTAQLRQNETTLLVIKEARGEKYVHACSWDLPCVLPSYIFESVRKGYAVPSSGHLIEPTRACSTPTREDDTANFTYNSEAISVINLDSSKTTINDTQMTSCSLPTSQHHPLRNAGSQHAKIVESLNISDARKAGSFLDGCKIYLSGFTMSEGEKLRRILSRSGASIFSELTDIVSHVLVGEFVIQDMKAITALAQKPHIVTVEWLGASINQCSRANEEDFYCLETRRAVPEPPSPLSQKGMLLLQPAQVTLSETSKMPPPAVPQVNRQLLSEFLRENTSKSAKEVTSAESVTMTSTTSSERSSLQPMFLGLKLLVAGFVESVTAEIEAAVQTAGGSVVSANFTGVADYAVVPLHSAVPNITAVDVVTNLWLEDCLCREQIVPVQYYHQVLSVDLDKRPLADCCISLSSYTDKEKEFLIELTQALGATYQDVFARVAKEEKGVLPSTHLVCPQPEGQKYNAAVRWGLPAVSKDWLLACARQGIRVDEIDYHVTGIQEPVNESTTTKRKPLESPVVRSTTEMTLPESSPAVERAQAADPVTPATPVSLPHHIVSALKRKSTVLTSDDLSPFHVSTPDTPYGQVFETPTAESKKAWKRFIDTFPSKPRTPSPPRKAQRRQSTPISELVKKIWETAMETSEDTANPNYSIEDMDKDKENDGLETPLTDVGTMDLINEKKNERSELSPTRVSKSSLTSVSKSLKDHENIQPRRISARRSTPTVDDFRSIGSPLSQNKSLGQAETARYDTSNKSGANISQQVTKTPQRTKRSPANEKVSEMLGQLHQRLSTPGSLAEQPQPLPQRELVSPAKQSPSIHKPVASSLPESQPILIGWEDPVESAERAKVLASPPAAGGDDLQAVKPRKFVLSNVAEKEKYEKMLTEMGETVITDASYNEETTHLVVDTPQRSEKLLCCLAAGKWILHTSYIDAMVKANRYLPDEEKYEWGNSLSDGKLPVLSSTSIQYQMACAATRWRKALQGGNAGAFTGMKAILIATGSKQESYRRLIKAGGGIILPITSLQAATHCFVELNMVSSMSVPLSQFVMHRVPCLAPIFLGDMLTKFPPPHVEDGLIADYRRLLKDNC